MLLVLAPLEDSAALWFVRAATQAGVPCVTLTTETLSFARRLSHRLSDDVVGSRIETTSGQVVASDQVTGVLNRMVSPPALAWRAAAPAERSYATAELHAFTVSWLNALPCPVRNRPAPDCLAGRMPPPAVVAAAAATAGLTCPALTMGTGHPVDPASALQAAALTSAGAGAQVRQLVCLDADVLTDAVPAGVRSALARCLTALDLHESLVGADFLVADGTWWLAGVTPLPDLDLGGRELVRRLLALFGVHQGAPPR